jgi:hypothetical protein
VDEPDADTGLELGAFTWEPWSPQEVAVRLTGVTAQWAIAGDWALDLFRGGRPRRHAETGIAVLAADFAAIYEALQGFRFDVVGLEPGRYWRVDDPAFARTHQTWVREMDSPIYHLEVLREPHDGDTWIFRRDPAIRVPYSAVVQRSSDGLPFLAPQVVLLLKAKTAREKDDADLDAALRLMSPRAREWLRRAMSRVHPWHPWLKRI